MSHSSVTKGVVVTDLPQIKDMTTAITNYVGLYVRTGAAGEGRAPTASDYANAARACEQARRELETLARHMQEIADGKDEYRRVYRGASKVDSADADGSLHGFMGAEGGGTSPAD